MSYTADIIPTMTSDTAPSGVASASPIAGGTPAWKALNDSLSSPDTNFDRLIFTAGAGYLKYQFTASKVVTQYGITPHNYNDGAAVGQVCKTWTFKGSNDGTNWTTIDTQTDVTTGWTQGTRRLFQCANATAYTYYMLDMTAQNGGSQIVLGEWELMETVAEGDNSDLFLDGVWG